MRQRLPGGGALQESADGLFPRAPLRGQVQGFTVGPRPSDLRVAVGRPKKLLLKLLRKLSKNMVKKMVSVENA